ncbi:hypothetical protein DL765_007039 [Monosporascus sp. GIB2]|nr:hypothetical protein DL765_007039 [Monosporascus sp. GIB2]
MLLDEHVKESLQYRAEQTQQPRQSTGRPNCGSSRALQDYQMQLMMLEQQNQKRLQLQRQAEEAQQASEGTRNPKETVNRPLQDYQMQMTMLEQQNQKRLQLQRQAEEAQQASEGTRNPKKTVSYALELSQTQPTMPEAQNQNRLGTVHQEQEQSTMTYNDALLVGEEGFGRGEPMAPDVSVETDRKARSDIATQDTKPHASPSPSVESLTEISGDDGSESSDKSGNTEAADIETDPRASSQSILCQFKPQKSHVRRANARLEITSLLNEDLQTSHESTDYSDNDPDESDDNLEAQDDARDSDATLDTHTTAPSQNRSENFPPRSGTGIETLRDDKAADHEKQTSCNKRPRPQPQEEVFMTDVQENAVKGVCQSQTDENAWWRLFRLLIPGMWDADMAMVTAMYTPYYHDESIPAAFPMLSYHQTQTIQPTTNTPVASEPDPQTRNVPNRHPITPQETFGLPPPTSSLQDAPVLEFMGGPMQDPDSGFLSLPTSAGVSQLNSNIDSRRSSNPLEAQSSSAPTTTSTLLTSDATPLNGNRMEQSYRRLRTNFQRTVEANRRNDEARQRSAEAHQRTEEAYKRLTTVVDEISILVEDILLAGEIPSFSYDKLVEVAEKISREKDAAP